MTNAAELKFLGWIERIGKIKLFDYQMNFLISCLNSKRVAGSFCRQTGKTTIVSMFALYYAMHHPKENVLVIAPTDRQAAELFNRMRVFAEDSLSEDIENITRRELRLHNGSMIRAIPTGDFGATIRGQTAHKLILEESSGIKDEIVNAVIMPMIASTDGGIIQIGTFFGKDHFYRAVYSDKYDSHIYDYNWAIKNKLFKQSFIDEQKEELTDFEFNQEYGCLAMENADQYFSTELVHSCIADTKEEVVDPTKNYYLGVDFARMGEDASVFTIARDDDGVISIIDIIETKHKALTDAVGRVKMLNEKYSFRKIFLDETGLGAGPTDFLKESGLHIEPITFSIKTKMDIFSNLKTQMEKKCVRIPDNKKLIYEMLDFRYELASSGQMKLHHSERGHDDCVDSLGLVMMCRKIKRTLTRPRFIHK